ncbi:hypothetical protein [Streptomyces europaeiscabiei]|uniref:hypothetical protein n=1 Tax=Streptomyces europaeiscabiei TaxID=146819 RepID=UPI002E102F0B|nr:hypothetical protein OHB30_24255 [Streptomyces europaeiscabiei]
MPDLPSVHDATIDAVIDHAGGATLPFKQANRETNHATAFWFNELVESGPDGDVIRQYLVTAGALTRIDLAEVTLRPSLGIPAPSASTLAMLDFAEGWIHLGTLGVAVLPTSGLHAYAERKGWRWNTDEITDGIAAQGEDIARIGKDPIAAYALCHDVGPEDGERDQAVVVGALARADDGTIRWAGALPQGCVGAPVFTALPQGVSGEGTSFKLVCAGVALPPDDHGFGHHPVTTFDAIREALRTVSAETPPPPTPYEPPTAPSLSAPMTTEPRKRRWWHRRS